MAAVGLAFALRQLAGGRNMVRFPQFPIQVQGRDRVPVASAWRLPGGQ